ncbi:pilus assembly protein CpaC [Rhizobium rhizosphaerae]|uniref:Pilus assembly protein CpaC n=1 Tax=Xaviernesmea rhizosphaerae TaxID=1672749 RepID=A0A1Q9AQ54_9HYPH|nr:pilus assembly protein CpaC [Xaviernesmea rhizosphaerae]
MRRRGLNVTRIGQRLRTSAACALALLSAFSSLPLAATPALAGQSVLRITDAGPGMKKSIKLGLNKALVVDLPEDAQDLLVADPTLADAVTRTARRIYLFGKAVGQTNIFIFGANGREIVSLDLEVERDITGLQANLRRFLPDSDIHVEIISDNVVLTGTVRTPLDSTRAVELAQAFLKGGEATTRNITAQGSNGDAAIYAERRQQSQIVNLLRIDGEDQVTLKVTVAEVSRQVLKQLGFSGSVTSDGGDGITFRNPVNLGNAVNPVASAITGAIGHSGLNFASYLNAMEQAGVMRTLAEPSLTAISGKAAEFSVGGEYRLPNSQEIDKDGAITRSSETVEYGIALNFTPVVLGPGRISLDIETSVSEPTFDGSVVNGNSNRVPGQTYLSLRKRVAKTSVELPSGGSIVIGGLVQDNIRQAMSGLPGISKIPVFGTLFRSKDFVRNETELVIIATPYLVKPVARSAISRPDDNFDPTGDISGYFLGTVNRLYGNRQAAAPAGAYHGNVGFIYK